MNSNEEASENKPDVSPNNEITTQTTQLLTQLKEKDIVTTSEFDALTSTISLFAGLKEQQKIKQGLDEKDIISSIDTRSLSEDIYTYASMALSDEETLEEVDTFLLNQLAIVAGKINENSTDMTAVAYLSSKPIYETLLAAEIEPDQVQAFLNAYQVCPELAFSRELRALFLDRFDGEKTTQLFADVTHAYKDEKLAIAVIRGLANTNDDRLQAALDLVSQIPQLFPLLQEGGPLFSNASVILERIIKSKEPLAKAQEIISIHAEPIPYWKKLYSYTNERLDTRLANANSNFAIADVPDVVDEAGLPVEFTTNFASNFSFVSRQIAQMTSEQKRAIANLGDMPDANVENLTTIPFRFLTGEYKRIVFAHLLSETINQSRSKDYKEAADSRNRVNTIPLVLNEGLYLHGSPIEHFGSILLNGNLPQEALGENAMTDVFPFHVDFSRIGPKDPEIKEPIDATIGKTEAGISGIKGNAGVEGQIILGYKREDTSWFSDKELIVDNDHALQLGGTPATEISMVLLRSPDTTLENAKLAVTENGFYIPIYNFQGDLLFTPEDYDRESGNLRLTQVALERALDKSNYTPHGLITIFKRKYREEFEHDAGVMERYSVELHTEKVLSQFDHYFSDKPLPAGMIPDLMRVALALHDVGSKEAIEAGGKHLQHRFTVPMMNETLDELGYTPEQRNLAVAMVAKDPIGECIKGGAVKEEEIKNIQEQAIAAGVPVEEFFQLLSIFYRSDAGSYTVDAGMMRSLDYHFNFDREARSLEFKPQQQAIVDALLQRLILNQLNE